MTQHQKILSLLADRNWVCTNSFYASYIADPRTRIVELKKKGYLLEWRWCQSHPHNKSKEWRLMAVPTIPLPEAPQSVNSARSEELTPKTISSMANPQKPLFQHYSVREH